MCGQLSREVLLVVLEVAQGLRALPDGFKDFRGDVGGIKGLRFLGNWTDEVNRMGISHVCLLTGRTWLGLGECGNTCSARFLAASHYARRPSMSSGNLSLENGEEIGRVTEVLGVSRAQGREGQNPADDPGRAQGISPKGRPGPMG
jgi:hypothetical protein